MYEESVGYQLKRVQHALRAQMDNALREMGLTTPQYAALNAIEETPGSSGNKIARRCFVTPQTMNLILANLESVGLIVRRPHPEYGRILQAYLTPLGESRLQESHQRVYIIEENMVADFDDEQLSQLAQALRTCADALEESMGSAFDE
ncbi:MAG: MarR family transcriptional regulator [Ktedonobacteraceae bacterium]|nr:MarR family transcriptional regulator [Ktedonobacteraceae bacterium]